MRPRRIAAALFLATITGCAARAAAPAPTPAAGVETPRRVHVLPPGWEDSYDDYHYTPVVRVGDMVIVSGIPAGGRGVTYEEKVTWMFEQLAVHLEAAGSSLADVIELTTFHAEPKDSAAFQAEFVTLSKVHHKFFPTHYPAWTAVGTTVLFSKGAPVELRAVAIVGSGANPTIQRPPPKPAAP